MKSSTALISHEAYCKESDTRKAEANARAALAEELRGTFDYQAWARTFVANEQQGNANDPLVSESSESGSDSIDAMDIDEEVPKKPKKVRKRLRIAQKYLLLESYTPTLKSMVARKPNHKFTRQDVLKVISLASGVKYGTVSKIFYAEEAIRKLYQNKYNRRRFTFGSGLAPRFPQSETKLAEKIREKRRKHFAVFTYWVMSEYEKLAKEENFALAAKTRFGPDMFLLFLRRNCLARRKPSNLKPMSMTESQNALRGWLRFLKGLLDGSIPVNVGDAQEIDPKWGRFPLDCRLNKDEVPGYFGDPAMLTISEKGEGATKILIPEGWGDRICSLIVTLTPLRLVKKIGVIFRGLGKRLNKKEADFYKTLPHVEVFFQQKAWVDSTTELEVVRRILVPHAKEVKKSYEFRGAKFPGLLDVEDNFSAHLNEYSLPPFFSPLLPTSLSLRLKTFLFQACN